MRLATAGLLCVAALSTNRIGAQQVPNRATAYLFPTDVRDPRAVWVNPAGLGVLRDASIYAELSVGDPGASGRLRQRSWRRSYLPPLHHFPTPLVHPFRMLWS